MEITTYTKQERTAPTKARSRRILRETFWGYLFLAPTAILFLTFGIYPTLGSFRYTLYNWDGIGEPTQYVGLRHVITVATDPAFWNAFGHTIVYTIVLVPIQLTLALLLALVLNNPRLRLNAVYRAIYFLPALTTPSVVAVVVSLLCSRLSSNFPDWMVAAGLVQPDLGILNDPHLAFPTVIVFGIWFSFGYNLIYFLAALQSIPNELYEAARIDGAGRFARFIYITVPMVVPVGIVIALLATTGSLGVFDSVWILTQGGPLGASDVVSTYIYRYAFGATPNLGFASAAALFNSCLLIGLSMLQLYVLRRFRQQRAQFNMAAA